MPDWRSFSFAPTPLRTLSFVCDWSELWKCKQRVIHQQYIFRWWWWGSRHHHMLLLPGSAQIHRENKHTSSTTTIIKVHTFAALLLLWQNKGWGHMITFQGKHTCPSYITLPDLKRVWKRWKHTAPKNVLSSGCNGGKNWVSSPQGSGIYNGLFFGNFCWQMHLMGTAGHWNVYIVVDITLTSSTEHTQGLINHAEHLSWA